MIYLTRSGSELVQNFSKKNLKEMKQTIGMIAVFLSATYLLPQIFQLIQTKQSKDLSLWAYLFQFVSCTFFLLYNIELGDPILIGMGIANLTEIGIIILLIYLYRKNGTPPKETQRQSPNCSNHL